MPHAQGSVQINRPMNEVFAFFADSENDPQWRTHVMEISRQGPIGPGMTYRQKVAGPGGRGIPADFRVTAYEPDTHLAFQVTAGPARPNGDFRFRATDWGTEVTFVLDAQLSGLKKLLMSKPVQKSMDSEVAGLERAKTLLESRT